MQGKTLRRPSDGLSPSLSGEVKLSSLMEIAPTNCKFHQGFPKGQSWDPLFLLHINDLPDSLQSQVRLFADDTAVYLTVQGQMTMQSFRGFLIYCRSGNKSGTWSLIYLSVRSCISLGPVDLSTLHTVCMTRSLTL